MPQNSSPPGDPRRHRLARPTSATRPTGPKKLGARKQEAPRDPSGPSGPPDPPTSRFKGFRDTSQEGDPFLEGQEASEKSSGGQTAGNDAVEDTGSEDKASPNEEPSGDAPKEEESGPESSPEQDQAEEEKSLEEKWDEVRRLYNEGPAKAARHLAAQLVTEERRFAAPPEAGGLYLYDPDAMVYRGRGEGVLRRLLLGRLGPYHSRREIREIKEKVQTLTSKKSFGRLKATPLANADLAILDSDPDSLSVIEPDPGRRFLARSGARWDSGASAPAFRGLLRQAVPSETDRQVLQDYAGYCLLRWKRPYRRVLLAAGPPGSGTSRLLHALSQILGWVSSVPPSRLARRGGASKQLRGPWANICSGIDLEALARLPLLKGFAPGGLGLESPEAAKRHKAYPATYRATKHVYAAEELPPLAASDQFYKRILLVAFPKKLPSEDLVPEGKLQAERDGILQWATKGLRRVLGNEKFSSGRGPKETRQRWDALSGPIGRLKAGLLKVTGDPQDTVRKDNLYSTYREFCQKEGVLAETKDQFTRTLTEDPQIEARKRVPTSGADQVPCYVGIRWRES